MSLLVSAEEVELELPRRRRISNFLTNKKVSDRETFVVCWFIVVRFPSQIEGNCNDGINRVMRRTPEKDFQLFVVESNVTGHVGNHHESVDGSNDLQDVLGQFHAFDEFFLQRCRSDDATWVVFIACNITPHHDASACCDWHRFVRVFDENCVNKPKADGNRSSRKMLMKFSTLKSKPSKTNSCLEFCDTNPLTECDSISGCHHKHPQVTFVATEPDVLNSIEFPRQLKRIWNKIHRINCW